VLLARDEAMSSGGGRCGSPSARAFDHGPRGDPHPPVGGGDRRPETKSRGAPASAPRLARASMHRLGPKAPRAESPRPSSALRRLPAHVAAAALLLGAWVGPAGSQTIDATTYPFTFAAGAALEDMSSGTTQLLGPDQDNVASAVAEIGFEFWFAGARQTGF